MPDYTLEDTVYKRFTTRAFATGVPTTLSGTPVVSAYEDDSATQITAGITLGVDHDSVTGLNLLTIVATAANGFETGKSYDLVITTGTVGGVSVVGEVVWHFTLGAEAAIAEIGTAGAGLTEAGGTGDHLTAIDLPNQTMSITGNLVGNVTGNVQGDVLGGVSGNVSGNVTGSVGSVIGHTAQTGDTFALANGASGFVALKAETALIVADTNELQTDDVPGLIAALNDISVADILTTALTESYAADGAAPTLAQAIFAILQQAGEFAISGTTITVKKLDGSTTAMTFTLDDASDPTSRTRAS